MPAKKRSSPDNDSSAETGRRATKVQKTSNVKKAATAKPAMPVSEFKEKARPLHVHLTHTPPSIVEKDGEEDVEGIVAATANAPTSPAASIDSGLISSLTLLPSTFSTGSYGWKGSRKVWVELQNTEAGENGREKVQVMFTINATVVGSKQAKEGGEDTKEAEEVAEAKHVIEDAEAEEEEKDE
ncbi:hypothetical protein DFP72DRAFT_839754 [Ephemerocybe angulata]|uniref:Uncharacterized protein n=1 Tax=Ephemerocybe angulata TaxID=980116 RepID=A0A8H6IGS4_9AGAR|nr:hypothetical protein DFP72DRAFT_839754 [Tulosesus angulatus]